MATDKMAAGSLKGPSFLNTPKYMRPANRKPSANVVGDQPREMAIVKPSSEHIPGGQYRSSKALPVNGNLASPHFPLYGIIAKSVGAKSHFSKT